MHASPCAPQSLQDGRFTMAAKAVPLPDGERAAARETYLAKHPQVGGGPSPTHFLPPPPGEFDVG